MLLSSAYHFIATACGVSVWERWGSVSGLEASTGGSGSSSAGSALRCDWHMQYCTCQRIPESWASLPPRQNSPWAGVASGAIFTPSCFCGGSSSLKACVSPYECIMIYIWWGFIISNIQKQRAQNLRRQATLWGLVKVKLNVTWWEWGSHN